MSESHDREPRRGRSQVLDASAEHRFIWPECDVCHQPLDFHSIQGDPTWFCGECGTV